MQQELITNVSANQLSQLDRDFRRFEKFRTDPNIASLACVRNKDGLWQRRFMTGSSYEPIVRIEFLFTDASGQIFFHTLEESNMIGFGLYIKSESKILLAYQPTDAPQLRYLSWGFKKSSATVERLFLYFRTEGASFLLYMDAAHPEHQFSFSEDIAENEPDHVQNLSSFISTYCKQEVNHEQKL